MPAQIPTEKPASKTTPQIVNMFRRTMILDEMMSLREKRYKEELAGWRGDIKNPPKGLNTHDPEAYLIRKHRQFYAHELAVIAEYEKNESRFNDILNKDPDFKAKWEEGKSLPVEQRVKFLKEHENDFLNTMSPEIQVEYEELKARLQVDIQESVVASYFTPEYMKSSPDFAVAKANVQGMVRASVPAGMQGTKGEHTGVVNLFNQKFKGVQAQLKQLEAKYPAQAKAGKALLATGTLTLNPSGFLIGKGIGAIMQTKAFASFSQKTATHLNRAAEKTGLKDALVAKLKSPKGEFYKKLAVGSVKAAVLGLTVAGLIEAEHSFDIVANVSDGLDNMLKSASEGIDNAYDNADEFLAKAKEIGNEAYDNAGDMASTFTVENGKAVVDSAKDMASNVMEDLESDFNAMLPDSGSVPPELDPGVDNQDAPALDNADKPAVDSQDAPALDSADTSPDNVQDGVNDTLTLPETSYEVQSGDTPSEIAELRLKEAGIPYDYNRIMKVVHMMADANEGMDNIHYIQAGWDLKLPSISLDALESFDIPEPEPAPDVVQAQDLSLPPALEVSTLKVSTAMELSEQIQSRFEDANVAFSSSDIDALTKEVLTANNVPEGADLRGAALNIEIIDNIVAIHGVESEKPSMDGIAAITNDTNAPELKRPFEENVNNMAFKR